MKSKNFDTYLELQKDKYEGEYIVLVDGKLINHRPNLEEMVEQVRKQHPQETPFVAKVLPPQDAFILKQRSRLNTATASPPKQKKQMASANGRLW